MSISSPSSDRDGSPEAQAENIAWFMGKESAGRDEFNGIVHYTRDACLKGGSEPYNQSLHAGLPIVGDYPHGFFELYADPRNFFLLQALKYVVITVVPEADASRSFQAVIESELLLERRNLNQDDVPDRFQLPYLTERL